MVQRVLVIAAALVMLTAACAKKDAEYFLKEGNKKFDKQEYDDAIENYKKAIELEPGSAAAYNMLGMANRFKYGQTRNIEYLNEEVKSFEKAIELDPEYWVAIINLGSTYYTSCHIKRALPFFKRALKLNPEHPQKDELMKIIIEYEDKEKESK